MMSLNIPISMSTSPWETPFTFCDDVVTGVRYLNLFDAMVNAVVTAKAAAGCANILVVVLEMGRPSGQAFGGGGGDELRRPLRGTF